MRKLVIIGAGVILFSTFSSSLILHHVEAGFDFQPHNREQKGSPLPVFSQNLLGRLGLVAIEDFRQEAARKAVQFPAGMSVVEVPFELERDRAIIPVTLNGSRRLKFLLDTGSQTPNLRGAAAAESLNLKIIGVARVGGAGSGAATRARIAGDVTFNISGVVMTVDEMVVPYSPDPSAAPLSSHGVIGRPVFMNFVVEFDWVKQVLRLHDPARYAYTGKGAVLPLTFDESGLPYAPVTLTLSDDRSIPVSLLVDTGANFALGLDVGSHPYIKPPEGALSATIGVGAQGTLLGHIARVKSVRLGPYMLKDVLADYSAASNPFAGTPGNHGLIGTDLLRRFKVIFDYSRRQMILEPNRFFNDRFDGSLTGFTYTRSNSESKELKITNVFKGSAASDAGLLIGDEIIELNGRPASTFTEDDLYRMFHKKDSRLRLRIKRGEERIEKRLRLRRFV